MKSFLFAIMILLSNFVVAQSNTSIIINGNISDWAFPLKYYDAETKLSYSIANNDSALYFCISTTDENTQMRLTRVGFQISIDPKGKKREKFNLVYKPEITIPASGGIAEKPSPEKIKKEFRQKPILVSLSGFPSITDDTYLANTLKGIEFAMDWDTLKRFGIEYKIPFSAIDYDTNAKQLSLGIILMPIEMPSGGLPPQGDTGGGPPSGMSPPTGMPPRQEGEILQGGLNARSDLFMEKKIWTKFKPLISK
jgi:hypothetical protein